MDTLVRVVKSIARRVQWANSSLRMGLTNVICVVQLNIFRKGAQCWRVSVCLVQGIQLQIRAVDGSPSASACRDTLDYPTREIVLHVRGARTRMSMALRRVLSVKRESTPRILGPWIVRSAQIIRFRGISAQVLRNVYVMLDIPAHQVSAQHARQVPSRTYQALPIAPCVMQALTPMLRVK